MEVGTVRKTIDSLAVTLAAALVLNARADGQIRQEISDEPARIETVHGAAYYGTTHALSVHERIGGYNDWFQEFRLFRLLHSPPFAITHPLIPRWTQVPGRYQWILIENPEDFRAEHTRFGNGFQSRLRSHRARRHEP